MRRSAQLLAVTWTLAISTLDLQGQFAPATRSTRYARTPEGSQGDIFEGAQYHLTSEMSLEFWLRREQLGNDCFLLVPGALLVCSLPQNGDRLSLEYYFQAPLRTDIQIPLGAWCHVAITHLVSEDGRFTYSQVYVNGQFEFAGALPGRPEENSSLNLSLGGGFEGYLDEVRFWNRVRSAEEIRQGYLREIRGGDGLIAVFPDGGGRELLHGVRSRPPATGPLGTPSSFGALAPTASIPALTTTSPLIDGIFDPLEEYPIEPVFFFRYDSTNAQRGDAPITIGHREENVYIAIQDLAQPGDPAAPHGLEVYFQAVDDDPVVPSPEPFGIHVDLLSGESVGLRLSDDGQEWTPCENDADCPDPDHFESAVSEDGLLALELQVSRGLLTDAVQPCFRVAFAHYGWNGICSDFQDPHRVVAPQGVDPLRSATWTDGTLRAAPPPGAGTCESPIELDVEGFPLNVRLSLRDAVPQIDETACVPSPQLGPDKLYRLVVPETGEYRIVVIPRNSDADVSLSVLKSCRPDGCVVGADEHGGGQPEWVQAELRAGSPYLLLIDGSLDENGESLDELDLRVDRVPEFPRHGPVQVVRAQGTATPQLDNLLELFTEVWQVNSSDFSAVGLASDLEIAELFRAGFSVDAIVGVDLSRTRAQPQPEPPPAPPNSLHFDRFLYPSGEDEIVVPCFYLYTPDRDLDAVQEIWVTSVQTGDVERVEVENRGSYFGIVEPMFLVLTPDESDALDGQLSVVPGDDLFAFWSDPRRDGAPDSMTVAHAGVAGGASEPVLLIDVDESLSPPTPSVPGRAPGEPPRPLAALSDGDVELYLGLDQVIFTPRDSTDRERFEERWGATLVDDGSFPGSDERVSRPLLYRFDPGSVSTSGVGALLERLGAHGELAVSSDELLPLLALLADETLRGSVVSPNLLLETMGQPATNDPLSTSGDAFQSSSAQDCTLGLARAWMTASLMDIDIPASRRDSEHVAVGVIDSNFCPELATDMTILGGFDFETNTANPFGRGDTFGFGGNFHGTHMASLIGAQLNNGVGNAGSGGQVAALRLYNVGGLSFLHDVAKAIRMATNDGCDVINMSLGVPCKVAGLNFCNPWTALACPFIAAGLQTALQAVLVHLPLPVGIPLDVLAVGLCWTLVAVLSEAEDALEDALAFAVSQGTICIASAGNAVAPFGESPIERFHIIPAVLPDCVAVGATDGNHANQQIFGSSLDVWSLESLESAGPAAASTTCTPFVGGSVGGTSSACAHVSGIVALMRRANPALTPAQLRALLRSSAAPSPGPAFDSRVQRFLRADLALEAAFAASPIGRSAPSRVVPALAFDEFVDPDGTAAMASCVTSGRRSRNDSLPVPDLFTPPGTLGLSSARRDGHGLHDFTSSGGNEPDLFGIEGVFFQRSCEVFELRVSTLSHTESGIARPRVPTDGTGGSPVAVDSLRTGFTWTSEPIFLSRGLLFEVGAAGGDDSVYDLTVDLRSTGLISADGLEPNDTAANTVEILPSSFSRTVSPQWIENVATYSDLNFHCPDDVDRFHIVLPEELEDCLDLDSSCGLGGAHLSTSTLRISLVGTDDATFRDSDGNEIGTGTTYRTTCPRGTGFDDLTVEVACDGRNADEYSLQVRYRVPTQVGNEDPPLPGSDDWFCCMVQMLPGCGGDPGDPPARVTPESLGIELWNPHGESPEDFLFDVFCPLEVCNPGPGMFHAFKWPAGAPLEASFGAVTASGALGFSMDLLDANHNVIASAHPAARPAGGDGAAAGGDGCDPSSKFWQLDATLITPGLHVLRIQGLDRGTPYRLFNVEPLPSIPPATGSSLEFAAETTLEVCRETDVHLFLQSDEPVSALQFGVSWDRSDSIDAIEFLPGPDLLAADVQTFFVRDGKAPGIDDNQAVIGLTLRPGVTLDANRPQRAVSLRIRPSVRAIAGERVQLCPVSGIGSPAIEAVVSVERAGNTISTSPTLACGIAIFTADRTPPEISCPGDNEVEFIRGNANDDLSVDISDPVQILNYLFVGGLQPLCLDAADGNDDDRVDISDPVQILNYLFVGGPPPPDPGPDHCGVDPTPSGLPDCTTTSCP